MICFQAEHEVFLAMARVIFNGPSCRADSGLSLNEVMMKIMLGKYNFILKFLQFQSYKYATVAGVTKRYRRAWFKNNYDNYKAVYTKSSLVKKFKSICLQDNINGGKWMSLKKFKDFAAKYQNGLKTLSDVYLVNFIGGSNNEYKKF